ncbi:hypothetical protein G0Q06_13405 [Puniceicoccales bacterium CK1056]|uniref:Uncharacterized protein n=1 Tax=Oceanipulchritudo coccoides TaxID=2706888 RepID=A0A6B2M516_9BACT|nr:hypothetical protein [Oceanipulchritudo coccoides]NDV63456.1 hypothetical protein [Oceanipulchritudo coccoides]
MKHPLPFQSFLVFSILLLALPLAAQTSDEVESVDPGPFYGFWEIQEPAGDKCVVIIKRGGRLSCFWAGTSSRAIQKGTWTRAGDVLTARWETGHVDTFKKLGDNAVERKSWQPGSSLMEDPFLTIRGVRVDSRIPGSLTIKSDETRIREEEIPDPQQAPAITMGNAFIGFWKIDQSTGIFGIGGGEPFFYLRLARSGEATVALRDWEGDQAVRGKWRTDGDRVIVSWPNNRRDVLMQNKKGGYSLGTYKPKDNLTDKPRNPATAEKVQPAEAERYFDAGNFSRLTVVDIRGTWTPVEKQGRSEYISIEGWGNAYRSPSVTGSTGTDPGKWRLQNDRVVITWVDNSKDIIRLDFPYMVQESYSKNEPITGAPFRTIKVKRNPTKE